MTSLNEFEQASPFASRHVGTDAPDQQRMLETLGYASLEDLLADAIPSSIREKLALALPPAGSEAEVAAELRALADRNRPLTTMIGLGYYGTITPPVIRRNVLENPAWYTAYTPYQPEISQGRLEALINFQTMVEDLTGLPVAGASVLDEGTAAAEAMALAHRAARAGDTFVVDADVLPQTLDVVRTRAVPLGLKVVVHDLAEPLPAGDVFGVLAQYPGASGRIRELAPLATAVHDRGALLVVAADLLALTLITSARRGRGRHRDGLDPALRCAARLRRPACRLPRGPCGAGAPAARPPGRGVGGRRRRARLPPRAADPRAAHPPGEGDEQHLHRPGAAGRHRLDVRRLPRPGGAADDRAARAPVRLDPGRRSPGERDRARPPVRSSTR